MFVIERYHTYFTCYTIATYSNNSKKDLGKPRTNLIQETDFIANGFKKTSTRIICGNEGLLLPKVSVYDIVYVHSTAII